MGIYCNIPRFSKMIKISLPFGKFNPSDGIFGGLLPRLKTIIIWLIVINLLNIHLCWHCQEEKLHQWLESSILGLKVSRNFFLGRRRLLFLCIQGILFILGCHCHCFYLWRGKSFLTNVLFYLDSYSIKDACKAHSTADVFINFASFRRYMCAYYLLLPLLLLLLLPLLLLLLLVLLLYTFELIMA